MPVSLLRRLRASGMEERGAPSGDRIQGCVLSRSEEMEKRSRAVKIVSRVPPEADPRIVWRAVVVVLAGREKCAWKKVSVLWVRRSEAVDSKPHCGMTEGG